MQSEHNAYLRSYHDDLSRF